jgi:hypothetical protein
MDVKMRTSFVIYCMKLAEIFVDAGPIAVDYVYPNHLMTVRVWDI